jgi:predicted short-subunit dehydrogenase-like oxidoreductase (DUF2520 family)
MLRTVSRKAMLQRTTVAIVGAGRWANFLAVRLKDAGLTITEIVSRDSPPSRRRARSLAAKVGARAATLYSSALNADLLWFCVPDGEIRSAASRLSERASYNQVKVQFAFHSSGALLSHELEPLRKAGAAIASVHPLMTFVSGVHPSLAGVPFALEGDRGAMRLARRIVRELGGESFSLPASRKAAYHAWATMTSPLLVAFLVTLEEAAAAAGLVPAEARRRSLPIIRQTFANYARLGAVKSFSGPLIRGDAETVAKHLSVLKKHPAARKVYVALAQAGLEGLPVKNRKTLKRLLEHS